MPSLPNYKPWPDDMVDLSPMQVEEAYRRGFQGAEKDPEADEELHDSMEWKTFGDAAYEFGLVGSDEGRAYTPYRSVLKFAPDAYRTAQRRGDCVSFSTRNASDLSRAVEIDIQGEPEAFLAISAPEMIHWWRGHSGEGANCSRLAHAMKDKGGLMLRKDYPELGLDLTNYDPRKGRDGRRGPPHEVIEVQKQHPVHDVTRITSVDEAADALANGYGISCCSGYGFASRRDEDGIARPRGSWSHAMMWGGLDSRPETVRKHGGRLFLVVNSWGPNWISGPKRLGQPDGSFWILERIAEGMIRSGGTLAMSNVKGWPRRSLPNYAPW